MKPGMKLLVIEDSEADYLLVRRNLKQHGVEGDYHRVDSRQDLERALDSGGWDAVLSDYNVPGMDFRASLALVKSRFPDLPVILVSGSIGEEAALDLLRSGLSDFVLKDRPTRLAEALRHSLETAQMLRAQRIAEAALIESESRFAIMFRSSPMGIGVTRVSDGKFVEVNQALLEIFRLSRAQVIGRTALEAGVFLHPADRERMTARVRREGRVRNFQFQSLRQDGVLQDLLLSVERIQLGGEAFLLGMVSDITPLKTAEQSLLVSEGRYRSLFENMSEGFAHCRWIEREGQPDWEYLAVNPSYLRVTGLRDVVGRRVSEVIPTLWQDNPELFRVLGDVARVGTPAKFEAFLPALKAWLMVSAYCPEPGEFVVVLDNITDRKAAEEALRVSQARFLAVFNASPAGIVLSRPADGQIIEANPAFLKMIGYPIEEVAGRSSFELGLWMDPKDRETAIRELRATGRVRDMDADLNTRSGDVVSVCWSTEQVEVGGEHVLVNLIQDETVRRKAEEDRRRLEAEVAHAQKLESLGALAGGVSHDMNNVLGAVMSLGSALKEKHKDDPALSKSMDVLLHAAGRGRDLVKGLTDFARKDVSEPRPMNLNEVVRKESALLTRTTLQKVQVELDLEEGLPYVLGDESSISNALMNLSVNALDAMPGSGKLVLRTGAGPGDQVALTVKDTGSGMSPEVLQRAMEPFFTTKPAGKGTGLGLALVYGIMRAHGGRVEIQSAPGQGTEITLFFPSLAANPAWTSAHPQPTEGPASRLRILLVDDDDLIRSTVPDMLEVLGHAVEAVGSGPEAIQQVKCGAIPDLVILDLSMPGMDGEETLTHLRALQRDLPVLLATGYKDERHERILERFSDVGVITKPFTIMDLRVKLAQMR